jgi:hypothetical protein
LLGNCFQSTGCRIKKIAKEAAKGWTFTDLSIGQIDGSGPRSAYWEMLGGAKSENVYN